MGRQGLENILFFTVTLALVTLLIASFTPSFANAQTTEELIAKKVSRLNAKASMSKGIIELDSLAFDDVLAKPRNYSMVVLFTAISPEFQCVPCKNFDPEYRLVAAGWSRIPDKSQIFFGILDFKAGQSVFQKFNMNSAPSLLYFPASDFSESFDRYDFGKSGFQAESLANWINVRSGLKIEVKRPFDFLAFSLKIMGAAGSLGLAHFLYSRGGKVIRSKYLWASVSLFLIFIFISGHMWNQIRHPPYSMPSRDGRPGFIAPGFQNQFGLETQIIAITYAVLCGGVISLMSSIPRIESPSKQRLAVMVWMSVTSIMYSVLMFFFRAKNPSYPFRLLF
ncbi:oligosaccharyl transferase subunit ost3/OST6 [Linnemannia gamsii]|uniref:Oligosaccharyl transferase subunit ost3/OST6 n=1 Tax=Linnemannia gamsii TaxID=64522 RepID=A0ABQ7JW99_9FUNG|nr:oligosaccharyl transferase subunit ost3/OST6 [Linnemannia gamsii]